MEVSSKKLDPVDAERLKLMLSSPAYEMVANRIGAELDRNLATVEKASDQLELLRAQGAIGALRTVLKIPHLILAEIARRA